MPWSYNALVPDATPLDEARTLALDVANQQWSPEDEIVTYWLTAYGGSVLRTALEIAKYKQAKHRELVPQGRTAIGISSAPQVGPFDVLVRDLQARVDAGGVRGLATFGIQRSDREEVEEDTDFDRPFGGVGRDTNSGDL